MSEETRFASDVEPMADRAFRAATAARLPDRERMVLLGLLSWSTVGWVCRRQRMEIAKRRVKGKASEIRAAFTHLESLGFIAPLNPPPGWQLDIGRIVEWCEANEIPEMRPR